MKVDLDLIEKMVNAGASGAVVLAFLRELDARQSPRRAADRVRKSAEPKRKRAESVRKDAETQRQDATIDDSPRARLYREGSAALMTMGRTERAARGLIAGWLKQTSDDDQLVTATILRAQGMAVADAAGWITASLKGKTNGQSRGRKSLADAADDLIARTQSNGGQGDFVTIDESDSGFEGSEAVGR